MARDDGGALLELLAARGTAAWLVADGVELAVSWPGVSGALAVAVDSSGLESALRLLVTRGAAVVDDALPTGVVLDHPRSGPVALLVVRIGPDGGAVWARPDGSDLRLRPDAFDPVTAHPRQVRLPPPDDAEPVHGDDGGGGPPA